MTACLLCILFESPRCVKLNGAALHTEIRVLIFILKISESHYVKLIDHFQSILQALKINFYIKKD